MALDPLSIVGTVAGLTATCVQTAKTLHDLKGRFESAHLTISAICAETSIISASLSRIQTAMLTDSDVFGDKLRDSDLLSTMDAALSGCYVVFDALQAEVDKLRNPNDELVDGPMRFRDRVKVVWSESSMQDLLGQLRGLQTSLTLLLQLLSADTIGDLRRMMDANVAILTQVVHRTRQLRQSRRSADTESIFSRSFTTMSIRTGDNVSMISSTRFRFDDEVVNSQAYRRAMTRAYAAIDDQPVADLPVPTLAPDGFDGQSITSSSTTLYSTQNGSDTEIRADSDTSCEVSSDQETLESLVREQSIYTRPREEWATRWQISRNQINSVPRPQLERQFVIHEIVQSEQKYLLQLLVLKHIYRDRLLSSWPVYRGLGKQDIFVNSQEIFDINKRKLFGPLQQRQSFQGPWIQTISDIVLSWVNAAAPLYKAYAEAYTSSYNKITHFKAENPDFGQWLQQGYLHFLSSQDEWSDLLEAPLQRLKRLLLFLQTLHKYTPRRSLNSHTNDYGMLLEAIDSVKSLSHYCDRVLLENYHASKIQAINARIIGFGKITERSKVLFHEEVRIKKRFDSSARAEIIVYETPNSDGFVQRNLCRYLYRQFHDHDSGETKLQFLHEINLIHDESPRDYLTVDCTLSDGTFETKITGLSEKTFRGLRKWSGADDQATGTAISA